ncbi:MAG TPA: BatA and WFA domain-containing protein [Actinomycetota bacterium]|nr:BatA and WFA domain-containing protein [Actinomycetota bacterium]
MSLLAPVAAAFGLVIPAIVALYFLRVRRPQVPVSSTLLWRSMIKDRQANVPWQRLRFSWLLVLQVLAAMAIVLALMRPAHSAPAPLAAHTIIMVDASAPMRAIDVAPSRFAEAKKRASQIIGRMGAQDRVTLMELSAQPKVLASAVGDRNALRQALGRLSPDNAPADLQQALALAASVSGSGTDTELVLLSDGITDPLQAPVSLPFRLTYQVVGTSGENVAITALSAQPGPSGQVGFVHVQNFGTKHHDTTLDWSVDGKLLNAKALSLDGGAGTDLTFALPAGAQRLAASLTPGDTLALDDAAWGLARPSAGYRALLVSPGGNLFLQQALRLLPGLQLTGVTSTADAAQPADLYIYDRFLPPSLPNAPLLIVDPPTSTVLPTGQAFSPGALQPAAADPLLADLNLTDVHVAAARDLSHANFGRALITSQGGAVVLRRDTPTRGILIGFDLHDSDLPLRATFPILVDRLVAWLLPQASQPSYAPGQEVPLGATGGGLSVTRPDGAVVAVAADAASGPAVFVDTQQLGIYEVARTVGGRRQVLSHFSVNTFSPLISAIAPVVHPNLGGSVPAAPAGKGRTRPQEWWPWAAGAALLLLSIEWAVFHRGL